MIKTPLALCLLAAVFFSCGSSETNSETTAEDTTQTTMAMNTETSALTEDEKKEGWQLLFDGTSTTGWHSYGNTGAGSSWKAADGVLYLDTTKIDGKREEGDLVTDKEYGNFHLTLD